jgi:trehalose 6-phosphate phosphatase
MRDVFSPAGRQALAWFAHTNVVVAFDYDGTLAPIVADRDAARVPERTRTLLTRVAALYPCVVISGRAQADALRRLRGVGLREVIGNHGLEPWRHSDGLAERVQRWLPRLAARLAPLEGVSIEDKLFSLAVHYRASPGKRIARAEILRAAGELDGVRVVGGKQVVNLVPAGAPHKGTALEASRLRLGCEAAIYAGDDDTDEDVFALPDRDHLLGIRVGQRRSSAAPYFVRSQRHIDRLLEGLVSFRAARPGLERAVPP